ncbi:MULTISPECIES: hypothetical protein [Bacillus amyloliquefaciens group]|uniref:Uncharacterized protein n=1 Tax=Bacillus amyloliquefaciens TaxID=1390 RepID=A0AAP3YFW9_BACAM|nr:MULTISPECIES: hypothetical protein [Bacillus amyloliquefaciens group]MDF4194842.1 hypothetical protein [Bacillus amyloliquefaciens]MDF4213131.1 hypothetical protein [Bacillus amyloliquefaciens]MDH3075710.1 hypothetical protein [Bacillus velezensis]MDH3107047.1 hypothetical protein [Bacillus velezensis]MDH3135585.1 hypothetical protein [Bacillus velezensis]
MKKNESVSLIDAIKCPHCKYLMDYAPYLDEYEMSGEFEMDCEKCAKPFHVDFCSSFHFTSEKVEDEK